MTGNITPITKTANTAAATGDATLDTGENAATVTATLTLPDLSNPVAMDPAPWDGPIDGAEILDDIAALLERFVVLPGEALLAVALWTLFTWTAESFQVSPLLAVVSPIKRCGKTTLMAVLTGLSREAIPASNMTPAAMFRVIEERHPTLIIDEADTWLGLRSETRGIINSGHSRSLAYVMRTERSGASRRFSTFAPKAIAAIGSLPSTIADRSIIIPLSRKPTSQHVERLRLSRPPAEAELIRQRATAWAGEHAEALRAADPSPVKGINDRAQDNWEPLLAIADACGGKWPEAARGAAAVLSVTRDEPELGVMLLVDIHEIFARNGNPPYLYTRVLLEGLHSLEERPWGEVHRGKPLNAHGLALHLAKFEVHPTNFSAARGYRAEDIEAKARQYVGEVTVQ